MKKQYSLPVIIVAAIVSAYFNLNDNTTSEPASNNASDNNSAIENYADARTVFWKQLYQQGGQTLYCGVHFGTGYHSGINIEHVYPMSWVTKQLQCGDRSECRRNSSRFNQIEADLHNLFPSLKEANTLRSSFAFSEMQGEKKWIQECDFEVDENKRKVEPRDEVRGDIARAMLYMEQQYGLDIFQKQKQMLVRWHETDPVTDSEIRRNQLIESIQGNSNSFIQ